MSSLGRIAQRARYLVSIICAIALAVWILVNPVNAAAAQYKVKQGDTLWLIALHYGVTVQKLVNLNHLSNANLIYSGQSLTVSATAPPVVAAPVAQHYQVRVGDNLTWIARRFGVSVTAILTANHIDNPNVIWVGVILTIPTDATSGGASAAGPPWNDQGYTTPQTVGRLLGYAAHSYQVNPALVRAVAWQESGWRQNVVARDGGIGVMQLMPSTSAWVGPALLGRRIDPYQITDNVSGGTTLLHYLLAQERGNQPLAVAAYNEGLGAVRRGVIYSSTKRYVKNVLALETQFSRK